MYVTLNSTNFVVYSKAANAISKGGEGEDVNPPPAELFRGGEFGQGQPLERNPKDPTDNLCLPASLRKTIALANIKATHPQIPY